MSWMLDPVTSMITEINIIYSVGVRQRILKYIDHITQLLAWNSKSREHLKKKNKTKQNKQTAVQ